MESSAAREPRPPRVVSNAAASWPGGAHAALSLSFDNIGEAAELELGAAEDVPLGEHVTATQGVPRILEALDSHGLPATFFAEGLNAGLYPDLLKEISSRGHEVAYHAWRHEEWGRLSAAEQAENLARGWDAFRELGLEIAGMRPPGGALGDGGLDVIREAGLRYSSPAGAGAGCDGGEAALLPFQWRHVDATSVLPGLGEVRTEMTGSPDPLDPAAFLLSLGDDLGRLARDGGYAAIVLHPAMLDWLGEESFEAILARVAQRRAAGEIWVARCVDVADHVLSHCGDFEQGAILDASGWSA
jgi:peptidoglycan/xylan/chitin deacetylase (PgdA/CDA1 family)